MLKRCLSVFRLAFPVLISQVGLIAVGFADNIMVGRYSTEALASSSFVVNLFNIAMLCGVGFSYGLTPLVGALYARKESHEIGRTIRVGLIANLVVGALLTLIMGAVYCYLPKMGQPEELLPLIRPFFIIYLCSLLPMAVFNTFSQWSYAIRNTSMPMWILLGCNGLNILGNYALIYGNWGAPELGLLGAGISTLAARILGPMLIALVFLLSPAYAEYKRGFMSRVGEGFARRFGKVFATSWPVSLQMTFETSAFSLCAVMAGWLGKIELAAFQIIVVVGSLGFCVYYSVGTAVAVLVANEQGRSDGGKVRRVAFDGYVVMLALACLSTAIFILFAPQLMGLFTSDAAVLAVAQSLILPLIIYQLGDATQVTFANALRGTSHVMPMIWIAFVSYVVVGLSSTWTLAFPLGQGISGIVYSFSISLFLAAALFLRSFLKVSHPKNIVKA